MSVLNQDLDQEMDQKGREIVPYDTVLGKHEQFQINGKSQFFYVCRITTSILQFALSEPFGLNYLICI